MTIDQTREPSPDVHGADGTADAAVRRWTDTARIAAGAIVLWAIVQQVVARQVFPIVVVLGVVFALLAGFLSGARRTLTIVTGALALVAVVANAPVVVDDLTHPSSGVTFSFTLWTVLAAAVAVVAGMGAFRRSALSSIVPVAAAGLVFAVGLIVAIAATIGVESDELQPGDVAIVARRIEFRPDAITVPAGSTAFWLDNQDGVRHTFTIEGTTFELDVPGYASKRGVVDLEPGVYTVICDVPGHENMTFELTVG